MFTNEDKQNIIAPERCLHVLAILLLVHAGTNMNPDN